jgi:RimJ/RimL family protein N-acetyltransferase
VPERPAAARLSEPSGAGAELRTARTVLRGWRDSDLAPFAELNADPRVMAHFLAPLTRAQSDAFVLERIVPQFERHG